MGTIGRREVRVEDVMWRRWAAVDEEGGLLRILGIPHDAPLSRARALMEFEGVDRLSVLGPGGAIAGFVTALDAFLEPVRGNA